MRITITEDRHVPALGRLIRAGEELDVTDDLGRDLTGLGVAVETKPPAATKSKPTTKTAAAKGADESQED